MADGLGVPEQGRQLVERQERQLADAAASARGRGSVRVACIQWPQPLMACGAWVPEMIQVGVECQCWVLQVSWCQPGRTAAGGPAASCHCHQAWRENRLPQCTPAIQDGTCSPPSPYRAMLAAPVVHVPHLPPHAGR